MKNLLEPKPEPKNGEICEVFSEVTDEFHAEIEVSDGVEKEAEYFDFIVNFRYFCSDV